VFITIFAWKQKKIFEEQNLNQSNFLLYDVLLLKLNNKLRKKFHTSYRTQGFLCFKPYENNQPKK